MSAGGEPPARPRWLPCVRYRSDRWWLPLSLQSADVLAAALMREPGEARGVTAIAERLRVDPPLQIFAALATVENEPAAPQQPIAITDLAARLSAQLQPLLSSGDAVLGCPNTAGEGGEADPRRLYAAWAQLHGQFLRLPHTQWLSAAADWLELTGPAIPAAWQQSWPRIIDHDISVITAPVCSTSFAATELDLTVLARTLARGRVLEDRFQDALRESKRAALKQLAYGLSHEINNPLANISTRAQSLLRDERDPQREKTLQRIIDQTMRAHEMVADLMFYAHPPAPNKRSVELLPLLRSVIGQLQETVEGRGIELLVSPSSQHMTVIADRNMLLEAIRALVRNAIEAIGCDGRVELVCYHEAPSTAAPEADRSLAVVCVRDSGPGLSDAAREHAFDPYFSGREAGRGLGVGLCRVERIVKLHGGDVSLQSGPAGCVAKLWFPQAT